ncbi:MAG TPA: Zn-dependent hydrolase [Candidatus Sulfotelmatobacter sp.]|nr:Zn-dependent hydrolase [Candidatus Sulfotelmatobacter sp.]
MSPAQDLSARELSRLVEGLSRFSAPGPGVTRFVYDDAWCEAQRWLVEAAKARGLEATRDRAGNLYLHDASVRPGARVVLTGSHLDTVRNGGPLDGPYGALAGLLLAAELRGSCEPPIVGLVTCEEEGSRFPGAFLGARAMVGELAIGEPGASRDAEGVTWAEALARAAANGCAAPGGLDGKAAAPFEIAAFLELHIEQGPVLESEKLALGIVDRIAGFRRVRATLTGETRHAGTTPMRLRHDALAAAAELALAAEHAALAMGDPAVATAGAANAQPGLYNVVAGSCELRLDVRHVDSARLEKLAGSIEAAAREIAKRRGVTLALETVSRQEPIAMSDEFVDAASGLATERRIACRRMPSGAGHDAMILASAGIPSLMLFVPSRGGISHAPEEFTEPDQLAAGVAFARELLPRLATLAARGSR